MSHQPTDPAGAAPGISIVDVLATLLRRRRMILAVALVITALMAVWVVLRPRTYTSVATFTPQATRSPLSALGGLAAQFGVAMPTADVNQSPAFYAELLRSRAVLEPLVHLPVAFEWKGEAMAGSFATLVLPTVEDTAVRSMSAVVALRRAMQVSVEARTGVVRVETRTRYPQLSVTLTDSALSLLNGFNVETRRSQAAAQRAFLEERIRTSERELASAEDAVREFAERNRGSLSGSPELSIQQERLNRTLALRADVVSGLAQSLEQAKLDEIRDTPLITVIERAAVPVLPDPRGLVTTTVLAFLVGLILGAVLAVVRHAVEVALREHPAGFAVLTSEVQAIRAGMRRLTRGRGGD